MSADRDIELDIFHPAAPIIHTIEITNQCNAKCKACGNVNPHAPTYIPFDKWKILLQKIKPTLSYLRISGGEPTLSPDFFKIIDYTQSLNIPFAIFTNGCWKNQGSLIRLFKQCSNLSALLISLHGHSAISHNNYMGVTCFEQVTENIKMAVRNGIAVHTNTVFSKWNINQYEKITQLSTELGAEAAVFSRYYGPKISTTDLTDNELITAIQQVEKMRAEGLLVRLNNCIPLCFAKNSTSTCGAGFTFCTIDATGNVRPCNHSSIILGNVFEQPMEDIWASEAANRWRQSIPAACLSCLELAHCGGGCRAMQEFTPGKIDPLIREPLLEPAEIKAIRLPGSHKFSSKYKTRKEKWGYLLYWRTQSLPILPEALELLKTIENTLTISEIKVKYGLEILQLIGVLFEKNLVELYES